MDSTTSDAERMNARSSSSYVVLARAMLRWSFTSSRPRNDGQVLSTAVKASTRAWSGSVATMRSRCSPCWVTGKLWV
jgi:hypothetical protein